MIVHVQDHDDDGDDGISDVKGRSRHRVRYGRPRKLEGWTGSYLVTALTSDVVVEVDDDVCRDRWPGQHQPPIPGFYRSHPVSPGQVRRKYLFARDEAVVQRTGCPITNIININIDFTIDIDNVLLYYRPPTRRQRHRSCSSAPSVSS
jgi:hypothetical protein